MGFFFVLEMSNEPWELSLPEGLLREKERRNNLWSVSITPDREEGCYKGLHFRLINNNNNILMITSIQPRNVSPLPGFLSKHWATNCQDPAETKRMLRSPTECKCHEVGDQEQSAGLVQSPRCLPGAAPGLRQALSKHMRVLFQWTDTWRRVVLNDPSETANAVILSSPLWTLRDRLSEQLIQLAQPHANS